jgi:hypothetical protein
VPGLEPKHLFGARVPLLLRDDVIGASCGPAFETDLSSWTLWIDRAGGLRQQIRVSTPENNYRGEHRLAEAEIGAEAVTALLRLAEEVGFQDLPPDFGEWHTTDQESIAVAVRFAGGIAAVYTYGVFLADSRGMPEATRLVRLWKSIEHFSLHQRGL